MTVEERIKAIEASGMPIAYDGCHKIYFITDEAHDQDCQRSGYGEYYKSTELRKLIDGSCPLVFVSKWGLNNGDFEHPWNIKQGQWAESDYKDVQIGNNDLRYNDEPSPGGYWHVTLRDADDGDVIVINEDDLEELRDRLQATINKRDHVL